ncbi:MAG: phosphoribosylanthranilate isomerase [Brevundimonas sp.]|uniref:phosphoribosylanthranilate isomerase n=1 Tax=Brevundimonas sp. TaxID=1871086 RepID=UPI0025C72C43|nr:phosphoribosylanthranilate isomerase [Brevundimonas sp.]MBX3476936.1 phosphoribosylanthranilate isomerase [Brevundimonas sp.]
MTVQVKICGLSTPEALDAALDNGAAYLGLVSFPKSPRHVSLEAMAALADRARGRAKVVVVTVDADDALLTRIGASVRPDLIQLHGHETPDRAEAVRRLTGAGIIKALAVSGPDDFATVGDWEAGADHLLFDARPPAGSALPGGVGAVFDWSLMAGRRFARPWFLAGGLAPENAAEAVRITGAPMVDVSSGVESAPGVKDAGRIAAFLDAVRRP